MAHLKEACQEGANLGQSHATGQAGVVMFLVLSMNVNNCKQLIFIEKLIK